MIANRFIGSAALIVGTSIGGGILSLPLITAACGPIMTIALLTLCWWTMYQSAKNILLLCHQRGIGVDFTRIISKKLTIAAHLLFIFFYLLLLYSLLSAYLVQGGELTQLLLGSTSKNSSLILNKFIFIAVFGLFIFSIAFTDRINKLFLTVKLLLFFGLCAFLAYESDISHLIFLPLSTYAVLYALPTLIVSFGFHNIIPTLYEYQQGDYAKTKRAVLYGSLFVLVVYIFWVLVCFLTIPVSAFHSVFLEGNRTDDFVKVLAAVVEDAGVKDGVFLFVNVSVITSFLGVGLSLKHYLQDIGHLCSISLNRVALFLGVFIFPLIFNIIYPNGFIIALQYASIASVVIFIFIPLRIKGFNCAADYVIFLLGILVIVSQLFNFFINADPFG